jgi:hypothetical protein
VIAAGVTLPARFVCGSRDFWWMLGHSISILLNTYAHFIPTMQDQAAQPARKKSSLGFAAKYAAQLMDDIITPILMEVEYLN